MSIKTQINRLKSNIQNCLTAVTSKGVTVVSGSTSDDLAGLISQINNGAGATAAASDIASGKTATVNGVTVTGTYSPPSLASQTPGTAAAGDIASGKTAWVNGAKVTGNYVAPAPGYQYEEVTMAAVNGAATTYSVRTSLNSITTYCGAASGGWSQSSTEPIIGIADGKLWKAAWDGSYGVTITNYSTGTTVSISGGLLSVKTGSSQRYVKMKFLFVGN